MQKPILWRGGMLNQVIPVLTEEAYQALVKMGRHFWATNSFEGVDAEVRQQLVEGTFTFVPPKRYKASDSQAVHSGDWNLLDFLQTVCEVRVFNLPFRPPFSGRSSLYRLDWDRGYRPNTTLFAAIQAHAQQLAQERAVQALSLAS